MTRPPRPSRRRRRSTPATSCVPTEDEAKKALARVKAGEDFAKVATELSKDPSGNGGDLGWFTKDRMVPEFSAAAFKLKKGEVSDPVKTQFGWHIIKVEDTRTKSFPPFEQVKDQAARYVAQKAESEAIAQLHNAAKIELFDADGKPLPPAAEAPGRSRARRPPPPRRSRRRPDLKSRLSRERRRARSPLPSGTAHGRSRAPFAARAENLSRSAADRRRALRDDRGGGALFGANRRHDGAVRPAGGGRGRVHPLEVPLGAGRLVPRASEGRARRAR